MTMVIHTSITGITVLSPSVVWLASRFFYPVLLNYYRDHVNRDVPCHDRPGWPTFHFFALYLSQS